MSDPVSSVRLSESNRVEAFSDAVFAIVITILVLDLRVPPYEPGHLLSALTGMWASMRSWSSRLSSPPFWRWHCGRFH